MSGYQLIFLDPMGCTDGAAMIDFESDAAACGYVAGLADPRPAELWRDGAQVAAFPGWMRGGTGRVSTETASGPGPDPTRMTHIRRPAFDLRQPERDVGPSREPEGPVCAGALKHPT